MPLLNTHSGILEVCHHGQWLADSQTESSAAKATEPLEQIIEELTRIAEVEAAIHSLCVTHMARCGLTSWDGGDCALNFWCNGFDATLRWNVSANTLDPSDPPVCLLSVTLGERGTRIIYGGVVADLHGAGPLLLSQAVLSLITETLRYEAVQND
jgi:hypothetical protein